MAYERTIVIGNIGSVEPMRSGGGNPYIRMSLGLNRGSGEHRKTVWYSVLFFGSMAHDTEKFMARYRKGRQVLVEGRPQVEAYIRNDGSAGLDNVIVATSMPELLDAPRSA